MMKLSTIGVTVNWLNRRRAAFIFAKLKVMPVAAMMRKRYKTGSLNSLNSTKVKTILPEGPRNPCKSPEKMHKTKR